MYRVLNQINQKQRYCRKSSPKTTLKLWQSLEQMSDNYQRSRRPFIKKLFADNISVFESESKLKTIIANALEDKLVAEEVNRRKGYRLRPLVDNRTEFLSQTTNDWYCFECHTSAQNEPLIGCKSCFRAFHQTCLEMSGRSSGQSVTGSEEGLRHTLDQLVVNRSQEVLSNGSEDKSRNGSEEVLKNGSEGQTLNGLKEQSLNGSDEVLNNGFKEVLSNGSEVQSLNGWTTDCPNVGPIKAQEVVNHCVEQSTESVDNSCDVFTAFPSLSPNLLEFECSYCLQYKYPDNNFRAKQICGEELNLLIQLFLKTIEKELKEEEDIDIYSHYSIESTLISYSLLYYPLDLKIIRRKVFEIRNYSSFVEFQNDLRHFVHNYCVVKDKDLIQPFVDRIDEELELLGECFDCYLWNRAPKEDRVSAEVWFTRVCDPPHRLVYAKVKGWPYWPSKVLRWDPDSEECKVQFFEPKLYCIAMVPKNTIKEMDYKIDAKVLQKEKIVESVALLFRYLKNLRQSQGSDFMYEDVFKRLEGVLTRKWMKFV